MEESLSQFLRNHVCYDNNNITHTRIGNTDLGIFSGKYTIEKNDIDTFYSLYHKKVFIDKKPEKKLTKKELKAKEDAEFEAYMAGVAVADAPKEESK